MSISLQLFSNDMIEIHCREEKFSDDETEPVVKMECEVDNQHDVSFLNKTNFVIKSEPDTSDEEQLECKPDLSEDLYQIPNMLININTKIVREENRTKKRDEYFDSVNTYLEEIPQRNHIFMH